MAKSDQSVNRVQTPNEAKAAIRKCMKVQRPVFMWGPPGIGKSDIVHQLGEEQGREVIDVRLSLWEPTDIKGIPYYNSDEKSMTWAPPSELPQDEDNYQKTDAIRGVRRNRPSFTLPSLFRVGH